MSNQSETRTVTSLRTGTKVALITALCFLAIAAYYFLTPTNFLGKDGGIFGCGSPMSPNDSQLGKTQCSIIEKVARNKAILFLALSLITALLGFLLFGTDKSDQARGERRRLEDEEVDDDVEAHDDDADEARAGRGRGVLAGRSERRPRLGDEDAPPQRPAKVRARLADDDERGSRASRRSRLDDDDEFDAIRD